MYQPLSVYSEELVAEGICLKIFDEYAHGIILIKFIDLRDIYFVNGLMMNLPDVEIRLDLCD